MIPLDPGHQPGIHEFSSEFCFFGKANRSYFAKSEPNPEVGGFSKG